MPALNRVTKHVKAGQWNDLEFCINQPVVIMIKNPAGAKIRSRALWLSFGEQLLDGTNVKELRWNWGWGQIFVNVELDVTYYYGVAGPPGTIIRVDL